MCLPAGVLGKTSVLTLRQRVGNDRPLLQGLVHLSGKLPGKHQAPHYTFMMASLEPLCRLALHSSGIDAVYC